MRVHVARVNFNILPEESGVYFLYQRGNILVYIGKAKNIKSRIAQHDLVKDFEFINYELTHYSRARTYEKELLLEYEKSHNQLPFYNKQH
jgi:excinuclease UvrABC nuclease subunit